MSTNLQADELSKKFSQWKPFKILRNQIRTNKKPKNHSRKRFFSMQSGRNQKSIAQKRKNSLQMTHSYSSTPTVKKDYDYQQLYNPIMGPNGKERLYDEQPMLQKQSYSSPPMICNEHDQQDLSYQHYFNTSQQSDNCPIDINFWDDRNNNDYFYDDISYNNNRNIYNNVSGIQGNNTNDRFMDAVLDINDNNDTPKYCNGVPTPNGNQIINYSQYEEDRINLNRNSLACQQRNPLDSFSSYDSDYINFI